MNTGLRGMEHPPAGVNRVAQRACTADGLQRGCSAPACVVSSHSIVTLPPASSPGYPGWAAGISTPTPLLGSAFIDDTLPPRRASGNRGPPSRHPGRWIPPSPPPGQRRDGSLIRLAGTRPRDGAASFLRSLQPGLQPLARRVAEGLGGWWWFRTRFGMPVRCLMQEAQPVSISAAPSAEHQVDSESHPADTRQPPIHRLRLKPTGFPAVGGQGEDCPAQRPQHVSEPVHRDTGPRTGCLRDLFGLALIRFSLKWSPSGPNPYIPWAKQRPPVP
jgi:hypothetical protein